MFFNVQQSIINNRVKLFITLRHWLSISESIKLKQHCSLCFDWGLIWPFKGKANSATMQIRCILSWIKSLRVEGLFTYIKHARYRLLQQTDLWREAHELKMSPNTWFKCIVLTEGCKNRATYIKCVSWSKDSCLCVCACVCVLGIFLFL